MVKKTSDDSKTRPWRIL